MNKIRLIYGLIAILGMFMPIVGIVIGAVRYSKTKDKVKELVHEEYKLGQEKGGIDYIDHMDDLPNEYWKMSFKQLRQIPRVWEIVSKYYEVAKLSVGMYYRPNFEDLILDELEYLMRYDMGGGIWIGQFFEVKQELYDMVHYGLI